VAASAEDYCRDWMAELYETVQPTLTAHRQPGKGTMKRLLYLATLSTMALLMFAPAALAQDQMQQMQGQMQQMEPQMQQHMQEHMQQMQGQMQEHMQEHMQQLPDTGGISLLLPAAALLLGSGISGLAVLARSS
jgi:glucose/arabinose dehydrogenase